MCRIKKRGLDYFPIDIDFMQNRLVRRIMKREGEGSLATLLAPSPASTAERVTTSVQTNSSTKTFPQASTTRQPVT